MDETTVKDKPVIRDKPSISRRFTELIVSVAAFCIAIGELDATFHAADYYYEAFVSEFTDTYDYEKLGKIHVGNTQFYLETLYGKPMVSKDIEVGDKKYKIHYYYANKYLLSVFLTKSRITAYTVLNFKDDFHPKVNSIENKNLGEFTFSEASGLVDYFIDTSAAMNSFIQVHEYGRRGFFRKYYYGYIDYGADTLQDKAQLVLLSKTAKLEVMGDEAFEASFSQLQNQFRPNMYGEGEIDLNLIRQGLLSEFEFKSYFYEGEE